MRIDQRMDLAAQLGPIGCVTVVLQGAVPFLRMSRNTLMTEHALPDKSSDSFSPTVGEMEHWHLGERASRVHVYEPAIPGILFST